MKRILILLILLSTVAEAQLLERAGRRVLGRGGLSRVGSSLLPFTDSISTDGALGPRWTAPATWVVSGGTVTCTPTLGAELITNGNMEAWTTVTNAVDWNESVAGSSTVTKDSTHVHGGSYALAMNGDTSNSSVQLSSGVAPAGHWYRADMWAYASAASKSITTLNKSSLLALGTGSYGSFISTFRKASDSQFNIIRGELTSASAYVDDVSGKRITLPSTIATVNAGVADVDVSVGKVRTAYTASGLVVSYADTLNMVLAYGDGFGNCVLAKRVAGTWTTVITGAITYVAGAPIRVTKSGNNYSLFYNNVQVGSTTAITDAAIVSNTKHGIFSTYSGNALDGFTVRAYP